MCESVESLDVYNVEAAECHAVKHDYSYLLVMGRINSHGGYSVCGIEAVYFDSGLEHAVDPVASAKDNAHNRSIAMVHSKWSIINSENPDFRLYYSKFHHQ